MLKLYAIMDQKGGVSKSTTCLISAAALTELGKKELMVDLHPQAGLTTRQTVKQTRKGCFSPAKIAERQAL